jgi:outer membrane protein assembly factor BamA
LVLSKPDQNFFPLFQRIVSTTSVGTFFCGLLGLLLFNGLILCAQEPLVYTVGKVTITGNKITKERVIRREMMYKEGDTIHANHLRQQLDRIKFNVQNTLLFIFVNVDTASTGGNTLELKIAVKERWYIFPVPYVYVAERNFSTWIQNKDLSRIDYGVTIFWKNFTGNKDRLKFNIGRGFNENYYLEYQFPYLNKAQTLGLIVYGSFLRNHEIAYQSTANNLDFYRNPDQYVRREWDAYLGMTYRQGLYNIHELDLGYLDTKVADTIVEMNPGFFGFSNNRATSFYMIYSYKRDLRDYKIFPLKGYYIEAELGKYGMGFLKNELKGPFYVFAKATKYWNLSEKVFFQLGAKMKFGTGIVPYYNRFGLGYELDFVRGYEKYVVEGQYYTYLKSNLKFALFRDQIIRLKFIKTEKFNTIPFSIFFNVHTDFGYVSDTQWSRNNPLNNSFLMGSGMGLELLTYYDRIWRLEYSVNRRGQSGFFLTFFTSF